MPNSNFRNLSCLYCWVASCGTLASSVHAEVTGQKTGHCWTLLRLDIAALYFSAMWYNISILSFVVWCLSNAQTRLTTFYNFNGIREQTSRKLSWRKKVRKQLLLLVKPLIWSKWRQPRASDFQLVDSILEGID